MAKEDNKGNAYVIKKDDLGLVVIAEEVVAKIAGMAALEVEGVAAMSGNNTTDMIGKLSGASLAIAPSPRFPKKFRKRLRQQ